MSQTNYPQPPEEDLCNEDCENEMPHDETSKDDATRVENREEMHESLFNDDKDEFRDDQIQLEKPKKQNRAALTFEHFVGTIQRTTRTFDEEGKLNEVIEEENYDKLWEDLFLKRIALFPTFEEASIQALRNANNQCPIAGTVPWFEGYRPEKIPCEVFHLERLLLRLREWSTEVRPVRHELLAFAEKMQTKTADVKSVAQFAEHRLDMLKKFTGTDWISDAMTHVQSVVQKDNQKKEEIKAQKREEMLKTLKNLQPSSGDKSKSGKRIQNHSFASNPSAKITSALEDRKQKLLQLKKDKEEDKLKQERKNALLEKKRRMQETKNKK